MNQLENNSRRSSAAGRSRARGADRSASRPAPRSASRGGSYTQQGSSGSYRGARRGGGPRRGRKEPNYRLIAIAGVILLVVIACVALALKKGGSESPADSTESQTETQAQVEERQVTVDGISLTGMTREQAKTALLQEFPWSMTVSCNGETYEVSNLMAAKIDSLLDEIYNGEPKESYTLDTAGLEEAAAAEAKACAEKWNKKAKNGSIDGFDKESGKFTFTGEENGFAIDEEKLAADLVQALSEKRFDAQIEASGSAVAPEVTAAGAKEKYKTLSSFTTTTTANKKRNTNIRLAAEALNGAIVKPGQEFSFNGTVGQRTEKKGYQGAAAYNNGEVVQEIGGGVCQVSTTLYNAVYRSGLGTSISFRRSHTFEPNYVTPGQDATVSWEQPDFKFINSSSTAIGIRASYANQKITVSIYGMPILEEGVTWDLESKKVEDLDPPAPTYEEDQTLQPGVEVAKSAGSKGSRWETYRVVYKNGKEVSRELDHKTTYKGHAPVIRRNTSGVVLAPEETTTTAETAPSTVDGMPEGYVPGDGTIAAPSASAGAGEGGPGTVTEPAGSSGPGAPSTAAPTTAAAAGPEGPTTSADTSAAGAEAVITPLNP